MDAKGDKMDDSGPPDPESDKLMKQIMREQQRKEDAEMRRLFRKRGGDPVEELELQTGTARVEEVTMDQQKGERSQAVLRMPRR